MEVLFEFFAGIPHNRCTQHFVAFALCYGYSTAGAFCDRICTVLALTACAVWLS